VFDALDAAALATPTRSSGAIAQTTASGLRDVDSLLSRLSSSRSAAGGALERIDNVGATHDAASTNGQIERSRAEDLDLTAAISDFQNNQIGYQAALQTYASVQRLSLFDYLK
jgi:flagellar hook-associated protein 3 FlgL